MAPGETVEDFAGTDMIEGIIDRFDGFVYRCLPDTDFTMVYISHGIQRLLGYPRDAFFGDQKITFISIVAEEDRGVVDSAFQDYIANHHNWNIEYRLIAKDGRHVWMNEVGAAIFDEAGVLQFIEGTVIDVDSKKRAEAQRAAVIEAAAQASEAIVSSTESIFRLLSKLQILALNAQIEAARAGQAGTGFSIVAQEIKALAAEANMSASEITGATERLREAYAGVETDTRDSPGKSR